MKIHPLLVAAILLLASCNKNDPDWPGKWQQKASMPIDDGRTGAASFAIGGRGYIVGGSSNPVYYNDVYEYDPGTDSWSKKTSCPGSHFLYPAFFVLRNKAYVGICQTDTGYTKEFWEYDPAGDQWTRKADYPGKAGTGMPSFAIGEYGYVASDTDFDLGFWMYDPVTDQWIKKNDVPAGVPNNWSANLVIGNKGYTGAGRTGLFWEYDPVQDHWTSKAPRVGMELVGASLDGYGYMFAADLGLSYEYNPQSDSWRSVAFYGKRVYGMAFTLNGNIYYACGRNPRDGLVNDFWEFTPE